MCFVDIRGGVGQRSELFRPERYGGDFVREMQQGRKGQGHEADAYPRRNASSRRVRNHAAATAATATASADADLHRRLAGRRRNPMPATADDDVLGRLAGPGRIGVPASAAAAGRAAVDEARGRTRLRQKSKPGFALKAGFARPNQ